MSSGFSAIISRMNYINRWGLMRNTRYETLSEHSLCVSMIAHLLACTANERFGADVSAQNVACCAMYHDVSEIMTGDLPTPVKYSNESIRDEYKKLEKRADEQIIEMLPNELKGALEPYVSGSLLNEREKRIVKAADKLSALIKCIEEENNGNSEFRSAKESTLKMLQNDMLPETRYFIEEFLPCYNMTLDELMGKKSE